MIGDSSDRNAPWSAPPTHLVGNTSLVLPISLKASPVEIELPNGGIVRLPLGVGQAALIAVVEAAGTLRPSKAPSPW
jgi:hypothetical protein